MCCRVMKRRRVRRMANSEWRMGVDDGARPNHVLSRSGSLVDFIGFGCRLLSDYKILPEVRAVRADITNPTFRQFYCCKHSGRSWSRKYGFVHPVLSDLTRLIERTRNSFDPFKSGTAYQRRSGEAARCRLRVRGANVACYDTFTSGPPMTPFAIRHSPFASSRGSHV